MNSCMALGSPCLTPDAIKIFRNKRFRTQMNAKDPLCKFLIMRYKRRGILMTLRIQSKYFLESEGNAAAMSQARIPELGKLQITYSMILASIAKIWSIICKPFMPPSCVEPMHAVQIMASTIKTIQETTLQFVLARQSGCVFFGARKQCQFSCPVSLAFGMNTNRERRKSILTDLCSRRKI